MLGAISLAVHRDAWLLRLHDFALLTLLLIYARVLASVLAAPRMRRRAQWAVIGAIGGVAVIALLMDRGVYFYVFHPIQLATENARHTVASTIGHNGSVASLMLAGVFHALALRAEVRKKSLQILLSLLILLFLYIIVAARTVAVWLALPVVLSLLVLGLWRLEGISLKPEILFAWGKKTVALILGGVLLLGVLATWMAPDRFSTPLARLERLRPEVLLHGTRLRLWSIGLETLARHPWGVGFSGFKLDYPESQGLYFERNPGSPLRPTSLDPAWMHNEYLQAVVELGWPGALVLGWLVFSALKWAGGLLKSARDGEVPARLCVLLAMLGVLLHNLVSFEFHIVSSAVVFLFGYAWLASQGAVSPSIREMPSSWRVRWATGAILLLAAALQTFAVREYQAEELFRRGHELRKAGFQLGRVEGPKAALDTYREAARKLGEAFALAPYRGEFAYFAGCCHLEMGRVEGSEKRWSNANASLEEALRFYDRAAPTAPGPVLVRDRAEARLMLANLFQERQESESAQQHLEGAVESLRKAAWMNPSEPEYSFLLGQLYWRMGEASRALEVWAGAVRRIPNFAEERLIPLLREWEVKGRVQDAWKLAWTILDANSEQVSAWQAAERLGWALGGEEPDRVIERLTETIREARKPNLHLLMLAANHAFQSSDFQESEEHLNRLLEIHPLNVNALVLKCAILRNSGREGQALAILRERVQTVGILQPQNWKLFVELADTIRKVEGESAARDFLWGLMDDPRFSVLEYRKKVLELLDDRRIE
jgi:O-antigen ligase/tetratricopeptide (TPR) repeat protein